MLNTMYETIVVPFDGSNLALEKLHQFLELDSLPKTKIHFLAIVPADIVNLGPELTIHNYHTHAQRNNDKLLHLEQAVKKLTERGWHATGALREGNYLSQITQYATEVSADLVLISQDMNQTWLDSILGTSLTKKLAKRLSCTVTTTQSNR